MLQRRPPDLSEITLDARQEQAVHARSPLLVVGGPGTGKTTVAIEHALSHVRDGLDPQHLLVFGYGREHAAFLRDQIAIRSDGITREPIARTFHSFCYGVLRRHALAHGLGEPVLLSGPEQDATIRELLHGDALEGFTQWPASLQPALTKSAFARELRDLLSRATERNLHPKELRLLGEEMGRHDWIAASHFYERYREVAALHDTYALDPSAIIVETIALLDEHPELLARLRDQHRVIIVDEFHESDPSQRALLRLLTADRPFLLTADPDSSVLRFRGAAPESVRSAADNLSADLIEITLDTDHRSASRITNFGVHLASAFRGAGGQRSRTAASTESGAIEVATLSSMTAEARYVALRLREAHLREGIPWSKMAILVRSPAGRMSELQRACAHAAVPIVVDADALALAEQPAVAPMLWIAQAALAPQTLTPERAEDLLLSPYGGADALLLRAIRQEFGASPTSMLIDALLGRDAMSDLDQRVVAPVRRIAALITHARTAKGVQAEDLLWEIWSNAVDAFDQPLADQWRRRALGGGVEGHRADRDLDAVVALFEMAARFADRKAGATAESFFTELLYQEISGDTIAAKAQRTDVVEILTVHSAKGREWDVVAVLGVQEGEWPNLKLRGSLLGTELLVAAVERGIRNQDEALKGAGPALLDDERRLFHVAATRARTHLIITAVSDNEHQPSQFFADAMEFPDAQPIKVDRVPRQLTIPALVAQLRQELFGPHPDEAAAVLAVLRQGGIDSADPNNWWGSQPVSTERPVMTPETVVVTPSTVEAFETCELRWFIERHGGTGGESSAQSIGSAIHSLAEKLKDDASASYLVEELEKIWPSLDEFGGWFGQREKARVLRMVERLVEWHRSNPRQLHEVEVEFDGQIAGVRVKGKIDRLEIDEHEKAVIVDLKTGESTLSAADAQSNPQLALYQLALHAGLLDDAFTDRPESGGAELIYPASTTKGVTVRHQSPIDVDDVTARLVSVAEGLTTAGFTAVLNDRCTSCPARLSCPIMTRSVIT